MRLTYSRLLVAIVAVALLAAAPRTWTDPTGQFRIEAEFVDYGEGTVRLKKTDGSELSVAMNKLSAADQQWVRTELRRRIAEATPNTATRPATGNLVSTAVTTDWPQWRGPKRDGISTETGLLDQWPADGPPIVWQARGLGDGYASVSVAGGKVFTMGKRSGREFLIALDAANGRELWATEVGGGDHSNCTPTVDGNLVFAVGLNGDLMCADANTGAEKWRSNFGRDFGGRMMSGWGFSESPLVDGDRLICTPGSSRAMMAALDKQTGKVIWTTPMPDGGQAGKDGAGYSSIVASNAAGVRQYVQLVGRGVIGVAAENGQLLWGYNRVANGTANIPTPIVRGDYVFCSSGYGDGGTALLRLSGGRGRVAAQEVYYFRSNQMQNHHGGMILVGDHVYFGHGHNNGFPMCVELMTGKIAWQPGRGPGSGSAAIAYADGDLYFRYQDATMALIEANPKEYVLKGTFRIASRNGESWPHPVIAGGRLYLRDQDVMHCYDVAKH
jgi:outer membrane protein assembly factor BamB